MTTRVNQTDLQRFASVGFPVAVEPFDAVSSEELVSSVLTVMETPSARLVEAVATTLLVLAEHRDLSTVHERDMSEDASRRLGYLATRLAELSSKSNDFLDLASAMSERSKTERTPLTLTAVTSESFLRRLMECGDAVSHEWGVYGGVSLPGR